MTEYKHRISAIYIFRNGMVAVFDQYGQQMPYFQGRKSETMPKIKARLSRQKGKVEWRVQEGADFIVPDFLKERIIPV